MNIDINRLRAPWDHAVTVRGTSIPLLSPVDAEGVFDLIDEKDPAQVRGFVQRVVPPPMRGFIETISDGEVFTIAHCYGQMSAQYFADVRNGIAAIQAAEKRVAVGNEAEGGRRKAEDVKPRPAPEIPLKRHPRWGESSGGVKAEGVEAEGVGNRQSAIGGGKDDGSDGIGS